MVHPIALDIGAHAVIATLSEICEPNTGNASDHAASIEQVLEGYPDSDVAFYSGRASHVVIGVNKQILVNEAASNLRLDMSTSYAYGNHLSDVLMLELVRHPTVVRPSLTLQKFASRKQWAVIL